MTLIVSNFNSLLEFRLAPEEIIDFFPAVMVRINHSFHPAINLYGKSGLIS